MRKMEHKDFEITSISWHEVANKINEATFEDMLNEHIALEDYGSGLEKIYFVFLATQPSKQKIENSVSFDKSEKKIVVNLNLSFPHLLNASKQQSLKMMASLFIEAINLYSDFDVDNFDFASLKKNVSQLFFEKGLID